MRALFGGNNFQRSRRLRVIDDYGPVGEGVSQAHYVLAENGSEYIIKGPSLVPHPYVAANELIAVNLAELLGLPVLDHQIVEMNGKLFFGNQYMSQGSFYPHITEELFNRCDNRDRVYDLVVFDAWICNIDRHATNLVARSKRRQGIDQILMLLNDHSHCLMRPGFIPSQLSGFLSTGILEYTRLPFVLTAIQNVLRLSEALDAVEAIPNDDIHAAVALTPSELLDPAECPTVVQFLLARRSTLRAAFRANRGVFSQLGGGLI